MCNHLFWRDLSYTFSPYTGAPETSHRLCKKNGRQSRKQSAKKAAVELLRLIRQCEQMHVFKKKFPWAQLQLQPTAMGYLTSLFPDRKYGTKSQNVFLSTKNNFRKQCQTGSNTDNSKQKQSVAVLAHPR